MGWARGGVGVGVGRGGVWWGELGSFFLVLIIFYIIFGRNPNIEKEQRETWRI